MDFMWNIYHVYTYAGGSAITWGFSHYFGCSAITLGVQPLHIGSAIIGRRSIGFMLVSCKPAVDHIYGEPAPAPFELLIMGKKDNKLDKRPKKNQKADSKTKAKSAKEVMKTAKKDKDKKSSKTEKTGKTQEKKIVEKKKKDVGQGISKKRKSDSKTQELKAAEATPPTRRVSFKSPPSVETRGEEPTMRTPPCRPPLIASDQESGFSSPAFSIETLSTWKGEAAKKGLSLESYMEELSAAALEATLEEHMGKLMVESQENKPEGSPDQPETASVTPARADKNDDDDDDDSDSSEDSSSESGMDSSEGSAG